jgi:large subunit ribosomal protein L10
MVAKENKAAMVKEIAQKINESELVVVSSYNKLTVEADRNLRRKLHGVKAEYRVYKNTLTKLALKELKISMNDAIFNGPTSFVFSKDPVAPAKVLKDFTKDNQAIVIKGGLFQKKEISPADIKELAGMPTKQELLAKLANILQSPIMRLVNVMQGPLRKTVYVLNSIAEQKGK